MTDTKTTVFRSKFSEDIFNFKYKHEGAETWEKLSRTLVEDVCKGYLSDNEIEELVEMHSNMEFIAGGRYLYYAGRPNKFFNNCLGGETNILTDNGWANLKQNEGKTLNVLSPIDGKYYPAEIINHGKQKLNIITFKCVKGHQNHTWKVRATRTHHWPLINGQDTYDLRVGDIVPSNEFSAELDNAGFAHGFVYGDGNSQGQLRLCAEKDIKHLEILASQGTVTYPESSNGDPCVYFGYKKEKWKELPDETKSVAYIASFIKGWLAADGSGNGAIGYKLNSVKKDAIEWFRKHAAYAGIVITGELRSQDRDITLGGKVYKNHRIYIQNFQSGENFAGFKVTNIQPDTEENVYCPFEPIYNRFVIDGNIDTFNCYLLRSLEDSREDWADLSWKAESCLMTGGGIGNDYSIYREKGKKLSKTGGQSSGPISKMKMINEIGREVMQGGSRRSAIYASLNWKHGDAGEFLHCKDWSAIPVAGAFDENGRQLTIADLKEKDFNFPAPLDMTNISLNYDNAFLEELYGKSIEELLIIYNKGGKEAIFNLPIVNIPITFLENCRQALKTGEPGFSFNFFEKVLETLRNACTEVTSEDDSDVCNLASVNMSRISDIKRFERVCYLVGKFLLCGTMVAQLPYEKVYEVRKKNRRLGMGIMGVHEWLLQRGYRYEVVPELHEWLESYKHNSEIGANSLAYKLGINKPVAYRAIAPTGTIGILAGTTTGIEPLFAVAYKRRYLKGMKEWHYQYVIDGTAKLLIDKYNIDPYKIETALSLANDYERRIKFQADIQDYVDMSISSTINLPKWGSIANNDSRVEDFAKILGKYAVRLRGFTCYPDGARGGQPLTIVDYKEALFNEGQEFKEEFFDVCELTKSGTCSM